MLQYILSLSDSDLVAKTAHVATRGLSAERLFSAASRAHHDLKASMGDMSLEHQLLALANTD